MDRIFVRSALVRVFFVVLFLVVAIASSARAAPPSAPDASETRVAGALFTPTRVDAGLDWRARWVLTPEAAEAVSEGATRAIRFAVPLGPTESVEATFGVTPFTEGGQIAGVLVDRAGLDGRLVTA